jgi:hypothetical protein
VNGYYRAELIYGAARTAPWKTIEDIGLATLGWVHWHNTIDSVVTWAAYRPTLHSGGKDRRYLGRRGSGCSPTRGRAGPCSALG